MNMTPMMTANNPQPINSVIFSPKNITPSIMPMPARRYAWLATPIEPNVLISLK